MIVYFSIVCYNQNKICILGKIGVQEGSLMKELNMLIWITQLGLSVAQGVMDVPQTAAWIRNHTA